MDAGNPLLDQYVLGPTGSSDRACTVPTASGDADHYVVRFYRTFAAFGCEPSHLSLFRRDRTAATGDPASTCSSRISSTSAGIGHQLLGAWRAHGIDVALAEAWRRGVVLCGLSAGSLCWFSEAVTAFHGAPQASGLGCCRTPTACTTTASRAAPGVPALRPRRHVRRLRGRRRRRCTSSGPTCTVVASRPASAAGASRCAAIAWSSASCRPSTSAHRWRSWREDHPCSGRRWLHRAAGRPCLDELVLQLAGAPMPRILFLPTASGDPRDQIGRFHAAFGDRPCEPEVLSLFRMGDLRRPLRDVVLSQDVIYVGGGSMRNLLAIWQVHGLDRLLPMPGARRCARRPERGGDVLDEGVTARQGAGADARSGPARLAVRARRPAGRAVYLAAVADGRWRRAGSRRRRRPALPRHGARARRVGARGRVRASTSSTAPSSRRRSSPADRPGPEASPPTCASCARRATARGATDR